MYSCGHRYSSFGEIERNEAFLRTRSTNGAKYYGQTRRMGCGRFCLHCTPQTSGQGKTYGHHLHGQHTPESCAYNYSPPPTGDSRFKFPKALSKHYEGMTPKSKLARTRRERLTGRILHGKKPRIKNHHGSPGVPISLDRVTGSKHHNFACQERHVRAVFPGKGLRVCTALFVVSLTSRRVEVQVRQPFDVCRKMMEDFF